MADETYTRHRAPKQFGTAACKRCAQDFQKSGTKNWFCRPCAPHGERERAAERRREWRSENPQHAKSYQKKWRAENKARVTSVTTAWRRAQGARAIGSSETCACGKRYEFYHPSVKSCRDCAAIKRREVAIARATAWNKENSKKRNKQFRDRYASDPKRRLNVTMTNGIGASLRGGKKWQTWKSLVPYSLDELIRHIERQFSDGMSWENMGRWHLDHVIPLRLFKFSSASDPEFSAAWALTNLRPLWAPENMKKGGRRTLLL